MDLAPLRCSSLLLLLAACDPTARVADPPTPPNSAGDVGTTLPNEPTDPVIDTDIAVVDTDDGGTGGRRLTSVSAGEDFSCATWSDGVLHCWGYDGDARASSQPSGSFASVSVGVDHACAVDDEGEVVCWGNDASGKATPPAGAFTSVSAGGTATCGVQASGLPVCWGGGISAPGGLGNVSRVVVGDTFGCALASADSAITCWGAGSAASTAPTGVFSDLSAGAAHACAVDVASSGEVVCWGDDDQGQASPPAGRFERVFAGGDRSCAVDSEGVISCWGEASPGTPAASSHRLVALGAAHSCAVRGDLGLSCWGDDTYFQSTPPAFSDVVLVKASFGGHACVLEGDGDLFCMGPNGSGQTDVPAGDYSTVGVGGTHTCAARANAGGVACWGANNNGQTDAIPGDYTSLTGGRSHTCGVRSDDMILCWSRGFTNWTPISGEFDEVDAGDFHTYSREPAPPIGSGLVESWGGNSDGQRTTPPDLIFKDISAGPQITCGITSANDAVCWGADEDGRGTAPSGSFRSISAGADHSCGVRVDGSLACWGANDVGQRDVPSGSFVEVSSGSDYSCAITSTDQVVCWGSRKL